MFCQKNTLHPNLYTQQLYQTQRKKSTIISVYLCVCNSNNFQTDRDISVSGFHDSFTSFAVFYLQTRKAGRT